MKLRIKKQTLKQFYHNNVKIFYDELPDEIELEDVEIVDGEIRQRTLRQNSAMHLYFSQVAEALNDAGLDIRKTLKADVDIPWDGESVKKYLWKPVQKAQLGKRSTTKLTTSEVSKVWETFNRHLAKHGVHVPFPESQPVEYPDRLDGEIPF